MCVYPFACVPVYLSMCVCGVFFGMFVISLATGPYFVTAREVADTVEASV